MSKWKYDGSYIYIKYIYEICEFLDKTPNYLFFGPEGKEERLSPGEKEMIRMYRSLDVGRKKCITDTLKYFAEKITDAIKEEAQGNRLLVISANNRYIFPAELCAEPDIEIINFHYGYLPRYRGMNIPTWVIYNDEPYTGVTWHYVTSEVDRGEIIAQEKIMLQDSTTAYEVVREGMQLGTELFMRFMPELLEKGITGKGITTDETVYLDKHLPQDGLADLNAPIMELYRLLRSFDYGRTGTVKPLKIDLGDRVCSVAGYSMADAAEAAQRLRQDGEELVLTESGKELRIRMA